MKVTAVISSLLTGSAVANGLVQKEQHYGGKNINRKLDASCDSCDDATYSGAVCYQGGAGSAACATCGYYEDSSNAGGAFDCVSCADGYEIDVYFTDCTGYCVLEGTATDPVEDSNCDNPCDNCEEDDDVCFHENTIIDYKGKEYSLEDFLAGKEPECVIVHTPRATGLSIETTCGSTVRITNTHLMFTPDGYEKAEDLTEGDILLNAAGEQCVVQSVKDEVKEQMYFGLNCLHSEVHADGLRASTFGNFHTLPATYMYLAGNVLGIKTASIIGKYAANFYYGNKFL